MIEKINAPCDIRGLNASETEVLASEIRETIINTVSKNGGHLASNLGMVEAAIALHRVYDSPSDSIIFDVGHQCYAHKLITGRYSEFGTLRKFGGISGFTNPSESDHDKLYEGHSGTSVSAALGIAAANKLRNNGRHTVAVVGDGSLTNGMIYEALNNCDERRLDLVILINDNEMSISKNVGGLSKYLTGIRTSSGYFNFKRKLENCISVIPFAGKHLAKRLKLGKDRIKRFFIRDTIFEDLGLVYLGPVDGHDVEKLTNVLAEAKNKHCCCVVHMRTEKGRGYRPAEEKPDKYHSVGMFDLLEGAEERTSGETFSSRAGDLLCKAAEADEKICAITAAMSDGTGLTGFSREYPERFFDVGIAEEHAVTFAGGLAAAGMRPVLALYSTFSQRVYDQLIHDISLQNLPLTLLLDRCGIVSGDGITHQGIFDYAMLSAIPDTKIYAPSDYSELEYCMGESFAFGGLSVIRYPKGSENVFGGLVKHENGEILYTQDIDKCDAVIVTYGRLTEAALDAAARLSEKYRVGVVKLLKIYPIDMEVIDELTKNCRLVCTVEENIKNGGMGEKIAASLVQTANGRRVAVKAVNGYLPHGSTSQLMRLSELDADGICDTVSEGLV